MNANRPKKIGVKLATTQQRKGSYKTLSSLSGSSFITASNNLNPGQVKPGAVAVSGVNPGYEKPKITSTNIIAIASANKEDTLKRQKQGKITDLII